MIDKLSSFVSADEKKQINYSIICHEVKKINSFINLHVRGGKTIKINVDLSFVIP